MNEPSPNGPDGRDHRGRFLPGNAGGPGNPHAKRVAALRACLVELVTEDAMQAILDALIKQALGGNVAACREILDRTIGKPVQQVDVVAEDSPIRHVLELTESCLARLREGSNQQAAEFDAPEAGQHRGG